MTSAPDPRPLGWIALAPALLAGAMAPTYVLSLFSYPLAVVAVLLGLAARSEPVSRPLGNLALIVAGIAVVVATVSLLVF